MQKQSGSSNITINGIGTSVFTGNLQTTASGDRPLTIAEQAAKKARKVNEDMMSHLRKEVERMVLARSTEGKITIHVKKVLGHKFGTIPNDRFLKDFKGWLVSEGFTVEDAESRAIAATGYQNHSAYSLSRRASPDIIKQDPYEFVISWTY